MKQKAEPHFTITGLATSWDVSPKTVRRIVSRGELEVIWIGNQMRIPAASKADYERRRRS